MVAAVGGERNARRHASYRATYRKTYENQGVSAAVTVRAAAPAKLEVVERWSAVAKPIGTLRIVTDGKDAFQETTFGQDAKLEGDELEDLRQRAAFGGVADLAKTYARLRVLSREKLGDDEVFVLEASAGKAPPALLRVSARTSLVLSREKSGDVETYSDFRSEGGVVMPHRIEIRDAFGDTRLVLESILYDERMPDAAFLPEAKRAGETPARPRS
jgi:hypothetical protein